MKDNFVISIGREYGSGGREIGRRLADTYGIKCYDKELLLLAAKDSGISEELIRNHDERPTNSFLYSIAMNSSLGYTTSNYSEMPLNQKIFMAQYNAIKKLAEQETCIIVGRCADYALKDMKNCISIFIKAPMESKIERISRLYDLSEEKAKDTIVKTDKKRANYYNFYTTKKWADSRSYDLCVDSSKLGIEKTTQLIQEYVALRFSSPS